MVRARVIGWAAALVLAGGGGLAEAGAHPAAGGSSAELTGLFTNASYTRLQRPKKLKSLVMTDVEAKAYEATLAKYHGVPDGGADDAVGQNASEFPDSGEGLARIRGQLRTSWIVSPADGRVPYTKEARARLHIGDQDAPESFDNPEDRPQSERCITSNGSSPPQLSEQDANLVEFVQTKDHLAILTEKNHEVRIIPIGAPRDPRQPPSWSGNSVGHWEGKTLVVETVGFRDALIDRDFFLHSGDARIVERFTRTSPSEVIYEFAVTDPKTFTQTWRGEMLFSATKGPLFEYACHEGNYSILNILNAGRLGKQVPPPKTPPAPAPVDAAKVAVK